MNKTKKIKRRVKYYILQIGAQKGLSIINQNNNIHTLKYRKKIKRKILATIRVIVKRKQ